MSANYVFMTYSKINDIKALQHKATAIRISIVQSLAAAGSGHTGGSLGLADIFTTLYFNVMNHKPDCPDWEDRDRLVLSIGHVAPVLYATLAHCGYFPIEELLTLRKLNSRLQGHPGKDHGLPGIEVSSGSLGQGLSVATGMALAAKMDKKSYRIFSIHGDGELQEGAIWEAAMAAAHHKLNNLLAIVDRNQCQIDGYTHQVMEIEPLKDKWKSFGWNVLECDGNNINTILDTFSKLQNQITAQPTVIIAHTLMGKGIKQIENNYRWHGKVPSMEEAAQFTKELQQNLLS